VFSLPQLALAQPEPAARSALSQPDGLGISVSAAAPATRVTESGLPHKFWDPTNRWLFSGVAVFRALDYASTKNMLARGREEILLPDDVVDNSAGFAAVEAAGVATSIGLSYWAHRTGHHSIERWISIIHISVTGFGAARNYALESKHP
jgi:hypothetical protein